MAKIKAVPEVSKENVKDIFDVISDYGPWQRTVFILFFFVNTIGMWHNFAITFLAPNMDYWCISETNATSHISTSIWNSTDAKGVLANSDDQCELVVTDVPTLFPHVTDNITNRVPCSKWEYNLTFYSQTIVSEWDLVCEREWLVSLAKSIYMFGFMISVLVVGQLSDYIGRWPVIMMCYLITAVSGVLSAFSSSYLMFIVLRFFQAFGRTGLTTTGYVLLMEIIGPSRRTEFGIAIQLGWSMGLITLPAVAWFVRNWFWLQLAISLPVLPVICAYWLVPESPRWLMTQGKTKEFGKIIAKAAKKNGRQLKFDLHSLQMMHPTEKLSSENKNKTILDLVRTPELRKRTFNMAYLWLVNAFVYYSLAYNTNDLGGDPYLNFFLSGIIELPSYAIVFLAVRRLGRRWPLIISMLVGGAACAAMIPVPQSLPWLTITFAMVGKLCITGSFGILYLYTTELFPTVVRSVAIGSCSTCARIGPILAPFVRELGKATSPAVPNAVMAILAISSGFLGLLLPETRNRKIPDTLEEGERFGKEDEGVTKQQIILLKDVNELTRSALRLEEE